MSALTIFLSPCTIPIINIYINHLVSKVLNFQKTHLPQMPMCLQRRKIKGSFLIFWYKVQPNMNYLSKQLFLLHTKYFFSKGLRISNVSMEFRICLHFNSSFLKICNKLIFGTNNNMQS